MAETPLSAMSVYSARPTVRIDSKEHPKVSELILSMQMREREGGLSALELRVSNVASDPEGSADLAFEDNAVLRLGAKIAVYCGDENAPTEVFQGLISAIEAEFPGDGAPELVVLAEDVLQESRMARRTKVHTEVTIAGLARDFAAKLSLTPVITGFSENIGTQVQLNESDLAFLRRLLTRYDGDLQAVGDELHVSSRGEVRRGALELELQGQLRRARLLADLAHQVTEVTVSGWNPAQGQRVTARSTGANLGPGSGRKGAEILKDAIGKRSQHVGHLAVTTAAEAQALADAAFDCRARRFIAVEGTAEGNPTLRVGTHIALRGLGGRFDNTFYVVQTVHRYDAERGYETDFTAECAYLGEG